MRFRRLFHFCLAVAIAALSNTAWAQSRQQTFLTSQSETHAKGGQYFRQVKEKARDAGVLVETGPLYQRVDRITQALIKVAPEIRPDSDSWGWEFVLINERTHNAMCLPGGKIIIFAGLIEDLALTDDELASVIGHEIGHALREHGREKGSNAALADIAVGVLTIAAGAYGYRVHIDPKAAMDVAQLAGLAGATLFFLLPNSREMEFEADAIGVDLAARAGFNSEAAISLWQKMAAGGANRIDFLSTHPSYDTRISGVSAAASVASEQFSGRRRPALAAAYGEAPSTSTEITPSAKQKLLENIGCALPSGAMEALDPRICMRMGGTLREIVQ